MADNKQTEQKNTQRPPAQNNQTASKRLSATPFVFERGESGSPRAWAPSKPTDKTREQITVALGTVYARLAGHAIVFPMDVQIVFADKTSTPDVVLRQPWQSAPGGRGGSPLFVADDDAAAKQYNDHLAGIMDQYLAWYERQPADSRLDLGALDYATASTLIKAKAGSVRRSLTPAKS